MMMRGATSSCLFILICLIAASSESGSTTMESTPTTQTSTVMSSSGYLTMSPSTSLPPSYSSSSTLPTLPTSMASSQSLASSLPDGKTTTVSSSSTANDSTTTVSSSSTANSNTTLASGSSTANSNTTLASGSSTANSNTTVSGSSTANSNPASASASSPTGGLTLSTAVSNTTLLTTTPTISISNETSASAEKNMSTAGMTTSALNSTIVTTSSPDNQTSTVANVQTTLMVTTTPAANMTDNVTQTSTFKPTTIATTPNNVSSNSTTANGPSNSTVPTVSTNQTPNITLSSTPAMTINVTTLSTKVPNSSWTTQSPKPTRPAVQCVNAMCPPGSKCVNLFLSYICHCPPGQYMQGNNCITVKSFPGVLHLLNVTFVPDMNEVNTKAFFDTSTKIEKEMKTFFKNDPSYYRSIVWKLEKGSVKAFVDNIFSPSSNATEETVIQNIKAGIKNCSNCKVFSPSDNYVPESVCSLNFCDANTSECKANNGIGVCNCLPGYYKFAVSDRSCKACPSGRKLQNGACIKCPFGYGGFNCDKSYLLALVVVSCVLGGILLLLLLALMGICLRFRSGAYGSSSSSHDYVMWPKSEMPKIPRATMHWDGNQLEMQENGSTSSLADIHRDGGRTPEKNDDLKTFKGKQQSRYTYLCQGQENPYYVSDEKKPEYL